MKTTRKKSQPLRRFSWSGNKIKTAGQKLVGNTINEWYEAKHRKQCIDEIGFINSQKIDICPFCGSKKFYKCGKTSNGIQRFKCHTCSRRFNVLTGTIFDSKKIPISEWIEYLLHLFEFHSIKSSSFDNRNAETTGKFWLQKVFLVLKHIQDDVVLSGDVYIDEKFFSVITKDIIKKDGKALRGISKNKICIATGLCEDCSLFIKTGVSKLDEIASLKAYVYHIKPRSHLIHDREKAHNILIEKLNLMSTAYDPADYKDLPDDKNPLNPINQVHRILKLFMDAHGGYKREYLQDWLNLFWFISNGTEDKYDKVLLFIELAIKKRKRLRFREYFKKNDD